MVSLAVRPGRHSHALIREAGEFSVNIPRTCDLETVKHCGTVSGRDHDKFRDLGLTAVPCPPLRSAPMIAEFALALACRVKHEMTMGTHDLFLAEVVAVHGEEIPGHPSHRPKMFPTEQLVYLEGKFWTLRHVGDRT